jgi:hypothetical protein
MTFSFVVGTGSNITNTNLSSPIHSQFGNGTFMAGIWENGVWNSGWRVDTEVYDLDNVGLSFRTTSDRKWRIQLVGPSASVSKFVIGDKVSIGNIVAIDINEVRKLMKGYFTIIDNPTATSLIVEIDLSFPLRRIEKDSPNHRIKITKNIWLNGSFLNGYYTGIWNYGLFKGFPRITEMFNTHWIDGTFDGGHFNSGHESGDISIKFYDTSFIHGNLGLVYASPHGYSMNDIIYINKDDKSINPQYDGQTIVTSVTDKYNIVTALTFGSSSTLESGTSSNAKSTSLIQNFKFYDNNIASKVSSQSPGSSVEVFQFNSWIDVNYYNTSAVNIGKPMTSYDTIAKMEYTQNNLYGYPTNDILSSESTFRDSYSLNKRNYKLGTKYKIYSDRIGNASSFKSPFDMDQIGLGTFIGHYSSVYPYAFQGDGWTFSGTYSTYERSIEDNSYNATVTEEYTIKGEELVISSTMSGSILNNINIDIEKNRYTVVELDIKSYSVGTNSTYYQASADLINFNWPISSLHPIPVLNFNNINQYKYLFGGSSFFYEKMTYLPIYENVNHLLTPGISKYEYFFNKPTLSMKLLGSDDLGTNFDLGSNTGDTGTTDGYYKSKVIMDNLKYYEVDMIPFFQYFLSSNIYNGVSTPWQGIAPFIDKTTYSNLLFIDNISITNANMNQT